MRPPDSQSAAHTQIANHRATRGRWTSRFDLSNHRGLPESISAVTRAHSAAGPDGISVVSPGPRASRLRFKKAIHSARPTRAWAPALGGISPAREERRHEPALRTGLDGERGQCQGDRERDVIVLGTERRRTAKRGMGFVHPHRRVLEAAELSVVGPMAEPDRAAGMDRAPR